MIYFVELALAGGQTDVGARGQISGFIAPVSLLLSVFLNFDKEEEKKSTQTQWSRRLPSGFHASSSTPRGRGCLWVTVQRAWHPSGAGDTGRPLAPGLLATLRPRLPRGSRPATLLPGLQSHRLGDRDAAATACLASLEPRASRLSPSSQTLQGPGSAKVGLARAGPPLSGASWGSLGPPRGAEAPPYWLPPSAWKQGVLGTVVADGP